MGEADQREEFELFLTRKKLSKETQKVYILFYDKIEQILTETGQSLDQSIVNVFLDLYPHLMARASLKNYLEFKNVKDLTITRQTGRPERKEQVTISPQELESIRIALYDHDERYGLIFDISETCALRRQEVINIKAGDIDLSNGSDMFILIKHGKGNKERRVFVRDEIALLILDYLKDNPMTLSDYLFESRIRKGYPIDKTNWNKAFAKASLQATGKKFHPHQLRGTRATTWYDQGIDIARIQQRLGHSNISTTMLYIKPDARKELELWSQEQ